MEVLMLSPGPAISPFQRSHQSMKSKQWSKATSFSAPLSLKLLEANLCRNAV